MWPACWSAREMLHPLRTSLSANIERFIIMTDCLSRRLQGNLKELSVRDVVQQHVVAQKGNTGKTSYLKLYIKTDKF